MVEMTRVEAKAEEVGLSRQELEAQDTGLLPARIEMRRRRRRRRGGGDINVCTGDFSCGGVDVEPEPAPPTTTL